MLSVPASLQLAIYDCYQAKGLLKLALWPRISLVPGRPRRADGGRAPPATGPALRAREAVGRAGVERSGRHEEPSGAWRWGLPSVAAELRLAQGSFGRPEQGSDR